MELKECAELKERVKQCYGDWFHRLWEGSLERARCEQETEDYRQCVQDVMRERARGGRDGDDSGWMDRAGRTEFPGNRSMADPEHLREKTREKTAQWRDRADAAVREEGERAAERTQGAAEDVASRVKGAADDWTHRVKEKAGEWKGFLASNSAADMKDDAKDKAKGMKDVAKDKAKGTKDEAKDRAKGMKDEAADKKDAVKDRARQW